MMQGQNSGTAAVETGGAQARRIAWWGIGASAPISFCLALRLETCPSGIGPSASHHDYPLRQQTESAGRKSGGATGLTGSRSHRLPCQRHSVLPDGGRNRLHVAIRATRLSLDLRFGLRSTAKSTLPATNQTDSGAGGSPGCLRDARMTFILVLSPVEVDALRIISTQRSNVSNSMPVQTRVTSE